ncbi:Peptidase M13 domain protein, partial [mine drainage metagenome]
RALAMVNNLHVALKQHIEAVSWMSPATKAKVMEKWKTLLPKIGYPDKWRDWNGLSVTPDNYFANIERATAFNYRYDLAKIGKPTDRQDWA